MYKSMTGYGKSVCELPTKNLTIEIRSLNSKSLDLNLRMPSSYKSKEIEIRNLVSQYLVRGKVDFAIYSEYKPGYNSSRINQEVVVDYYKQFHAMRDRIPMDDSRVLNTIMRLPDVIETGKDELQENEWEIIKNHIVLALIELDEFRIQEGKNLRNDILKHLDNIIDQVPHVEVFEKDRVEKVRQRMAEHLNDVVGNNMVDSNRFEQELIFYIEKLDITEEKVRLKAHGNFFKEVSDQTEPSGKKLGFISQEIGREINTLGSKAYHSEIQKIVVGMKDDLEKIKEQLLNVL